MFVATMSIAGFRTQLLVRYSCVKETSKMQYMYTGMHVLALANNMLEYADCKDISLIL